MNCSSCVIIGVVIIAIVGTDICDPHVSNDSHFGYFLFVPLLPTWLSLAPRYQAQLCIYTGRIYAIEKSGNFEQTWKSQGILPKILEKMRKF